MNITRSPANVRPTTRHVIGPLPLEMDNAASGGL